MVELYQAKLNAQANNCLIHFYKRFMTIGERGPRGTPASDGFGSPDASSDSEVEIVAETPVVVPTAAPGGPRKQDPDMLDMGSGSISPIEAINVMKMIIMSIMATDGVSVAEEL